MKGTFKIGRIKGRNVAIHWTFILLIGWLVFVNALSGYETHQLYWSLLLFIASFASVLAHELGHEIAAGYFGLKPNGIILLPIGTVTDFDYQLAKPRQELLISLAGIFTNILIASILALFITPYKAYWSAPENIGAASAGNFIFQLHFINLCIAAFNLLPAFPMDGGMTIRAFLAMKLDARKATKIAGTIGKICALLLIIAGLFSHNFLLPLVGLYIIFSAGSAKAISPA